MASKKKDARQAAWDLTQAKAQLRFAARKYTVAFINASADGATKSRLNEAEANLYVGALAYVLAAGGKVK